MGTHPTFSSSGPDVAYQPKTTDEGDNTVVGGTVPHVNVQGPSLGSPSDGAWDGVAGSASLIAIAKAIWSKLAGSLTTIQRPFQPIPGTTKTVTVGPVATTAGALPLAASGVIPAGTATAYRVRNPAASASPVTWVLTTDNAKTPTIPTPYAADGTGGALGDKTVDPGSVEVFSLSPAQQTALAAGTLYLSAITPASGSAVLSITPGVGA